MSMLECPGCGGQKHFSVPPQPKDVFEGKYRNTDEMLQRDDLYEIYVNGVENLDKYRAKNYIQYIENTIKERI